MAETLKFGPEWLRALSDGNSVTSPPPSPGFPKYKLAEHRYGREEMLALFQPNKHIPEEILSIPVILLEKSQEPMAYIPMTDEEQRMMSQSVNSPAVLRMMGRGSGGAGGGTVGPTRGGGRGTISERGRGRGRGRGDPFGRPGEMPEQIDPGRGRSYMRSESWEEGRAEKRFERTGYVVGRAAEVETDPTSPRREYSRSMSDNWRSSKQIEVEKRASATSSTTSSLGGGDTAVEEDNGGDWRRATSKSHDKWANRNWRDRTRNNSDDRFHPVVEEQRSYRRQRSSSSYDDDLDPDGVPEWSTMDADDMDVLGTFDSSGAFMSMRDAMALKEEEEREERWRKDSRGSSGSNDERRHSNNSTNGAMNKSDTEGIPDDRPSSDKSSAKDNKPSEATDAVDPVQAELKMEKPQKKSKQKVETMNNNNDHSVSSSVENQDSIHVQKTPEPEPQREQPQPVQNGSAESPAPPVEPEQTRTEENDHVSGPPPQLTQVHQRAPGQRRPEDEISFDHLETAAEEMVANWTAEEDAKSDGKHKVESGALPWEHDDAKRWFYRDPQGELQGPFNCNEMAEWFSAGYFTMNLLVKRGCDDRFQPLGEIIKRWGRVPFLPGSSPPPLVHTPVSQPGPAVVAPVAKDQPQPQLAQNPQMDPQVMLMLQQQLFQQQFYIRQLQLLQQVQQNERCSKLPPEQQQALVLQLLMKQQQQIAAQAQQQQQQVQLPPGQLPQQQQQQKISPRSTPDQQVNSPNFQNNPADLAAMMNQNLQGQGANQPAAGAWMQQSSVWDLPGDSAAKQQAMEEFARMENMKDQKGNEQRDAEMRAQKQKEDEDEHNKQRHEQEMMVRQQEEHKRQEEQVRRQQEEMQRREEEMRRQQDMDRQRQMELQQQEEETRRRREEEDRRRQEDEMRQRQQEMEQRQREMEQQQQMERQREMERQMKEAQRQKEEMERRNQEEMQRRKAEIELEVQRQQEIQRRQEMQRQQEIHHQQQEALRRLQQQQQLAQIQLPSTAQWGSQTSSGSQQPTNTMSLAQIQQLQEEKERNEREEHQRQLEIQRQQIQAFQQQQQQQQPKKWGNSPRMVNAAAATTQHKTLMEIQEEQARQLEKEKMKQQQNKAAVPLATAAVWGGTTNSSHWAQEGAWGQAAKQQGLSFWDEAVKTSKNKVQVNNQPFPALNKPANTANNQINKKTAKTQREEENIQRLFQERLPSGNDDFSQWCESALHGMGASVDIPTFVTFLCEVDSPYEVHDYVRSYLGESREASNFAKMFIEKRSKSRNHHRPVEEDSMWGPAPAVNPNLSKVGGQNPGDFQMVGAAAKKSKKKMQKLDNSILGFTVHANPDRVNVGEIDMCD